MFSVVTCISSTQHLIQWVPGDKGAGA